MKNFLSNILKLLNDILTVTHIASNAVCLNVSQSSKMFYIRNWFTFITEHLIDNNQSNNTAYK
jgi:hypothetical protein